MDTAQRDRSYDVYKEEGRRKRKKQTKTNAGGTQRMHKREGGGRNVMLGIPPLPFSSRANQTFVAPRAANAPCASSASQHSVKRTLWTRVGCLPRRDVVWCGGGGGRQLWHDGQSDQKNGKARRRRPAKKRRPSWRRAEGGGGGRPVGSRERKERGNQKPPTCTVRVFYRFFFVCLFCFESPRTSHTPI